MRESLRVLDLFSGIGAFSLGLERAGMNTAAFCEIDPFCRQVLAKHWPGVLCYDDIRTLTGERLATDGISPVDLICGGFPCQDISDAGPRVGIDGERSSLWSEYARLIGELRPRYVIVENVAALRGRGLGRVLGDLAALRFDAEWHCIPAAAVGAPHIRDRIWILAYAECDGQPATWNVDLNQAPAGHWQADLPRSCGEVRDTHCARLAIREGFSGHIAAELQAPQRADWWLSEPDVGRVAHGVAARVDRLRSLGNSLVPQIPEAIGRAILQAEAALSEVAP